MSSKPDPTVSPAPSSAAPPLDTSPKLKAERIQTPAGGPAATTDRAVQPGPRARRLTAKQAGNVVAGLPSWEVAGGNRELVCRFDFPTERRALAVFSIVAELAQDRRLTPRLELQANRLTVRLSTHAARGITGTDVDFARALAAASWLLTLGGEQPAPSRGRTAGRRERAA